MAGIESGVAILGGAASEGLFERVTFEQGCEEREGVSLTDIWGKSVPGRGTAGAKALRWEQAYYVGGTGRTPGLTGPPGPSSGLGFCPEQDEKPLGS